jgi:hypothetical protein
MDDALTTLDPALAMAKLFDTLLAQQRCAPVQWRTWHSAGAWHSLTQNRSRCILGRSYALQEVFRCNSYAAGVGARRSGAAR